MHTTTLKPSGRNLEYLADSQFDKDLYTNAKYIKDSIDYNDNPVSSWLGNSSVELKQVSDILRAYVQLVLNGYVNEFRPNGYPKESIERIGAAAGQTSNLTLRCMKLMYWGVQQNRITTSAILYPKGKANDPNYTMPEEPGFIERMYNNVANTVEGVVNKVGNLTNTTLDSANKIIVGAGDTAEGLGTLGKYGLPLALASAAGVIIFFGYNIAKTSDADKVVKIVDKMPSKKGLSDMPNQYSKQIKGYKIMWSKRERRYIIKNKSRKRVYDTEYLKDAKSWVERNG